MHKQVDKYDVMLDRNRRKDNIKVVPLRYQ